MAEVPPKLADGVLPAISIIIVNWNGRKFIESCLRSLATLDYPQEKAEIILVDNASTDGSQEYVRVNFPVSAYDRLA